MPSCAYQRVSSTPGHSSKRVGDALDRLDASRERLRRPDATRPCSPTAARCSTSTVDVGAGAAAAARDRARQARELRPRAPPRVEAAVDREPGRARHDVEARARACRPADDEHRAALLALAREAVRLRAARGEPASGSAIRIMRSNAFTPRCAWPTWASRPRDLDPKRDRAAARVPDDAAGRLGREHRDGVGLDHPRFAQVPEPVALPVSSSQTRWRTIRPTVERGRAPLRRGAVEHAHEPALHVGGPATDDPAVPAAWPELRPDPAPGRRRSARGSRPSRGPSPTLPRTMHGSSSAPRRRELDQLGRETQPLQRVAEHAPAPSEPATGRVLGVDRPRAPRRSAAISSARGSSQARMSSAWSIGEIATR